MYIYIYDLCSLTFFFLILSCIGNDFFLFWSERMGPLKKRTRWSGDFRILRLEWPLGGTYTAQDPIGRHGCGWCTYLAERRKIEQDDEKGVLAAKYYCCFHWYLTWLCGLRLPKSSSFFFIFFFPSFMRFWMPEWRVVVMW